MPHHFETLVELVQNSVADHGPKEAFGEKQKDGTWKWLSYRDFGHLVDDARAGLATLGIGPGDRVAIVSNNRIEWAVFAFASYGLGAAYVPMYQAQLFEEWKYICNDSGAKVAIAATGPIFESLCTIAESTSLTRVIGLDLPASSKDSYAQLLKTGRDHPCSVAPVSPEDLADILYTSGTTGNPKGVRLTHRNICTNVNAATIRFDFTTNDTSLAFLPWAHAFGQTAELFTLFCYGATMAINDEVAELINNLPQVRPTVLVAVPRIFNRIYDRVNKQIAERPAAIQRLFAAGIAAATKKSRGGSLSVVEKLALAAADRLVFGKVRAKFGGRLRFVVSGSAALSTEVAEFIDALGIDVFEGYGLTETSPVVSANYPGNRKIGSIGKAFPGVNVRIDRSTAGDDTHGEIIVSGPTVMQGYHNRPEDNAHAFCEDGAFRTGDMGYIDPEGYIFITGRIKEQYKLENGKYVVPSPLEEKLKLSPYITNIMLHGANHPYNVALVVPDQEAVRELAQKNNWEIVDMSTDARVLSLLKAELQRYSESFKHYERPQKLMLTLEDFSLDNGQLTPSMKVKRRAVMSQYGEQLEALFRAP